MGVDLGKAYVQIVPKAEGITGSISKVLDGEAESAGTSAGFKIGAFAKKALAGAAIGAVVVKGLKDALSQGAELEQNMGGAHAVFGDTLYKNLETKATQAYKNMGLSASEYYATANKMGSLFQGSGISQQKSLDLSTKAMQRAADVASVMGIDTTMAMESIAGAAKGNFTMMDNLGVAMNATTLAAYALEKGINFDWNTASNAEKAELAMKMFMDRTSQYEGNFARESEETFSGSLGALKAAYQDFMGNLAIGQNVGESMKNLVSTATTFVFNNLIPTIGTVLKGLPGALVVFIQQGVPALLSGLSNVIATVATSVKSFADGLTGEKVQAWVTTSLPKILSAAGTIIKTFASGLLKNLPTIVSAVGRIGIAIITGLGSAIWGKVSAAAAGIRDRFLRPINAMKDKVKGIIDKIKGFFPVSIGRVMSNLKLPHFSISGKFSINPPSTPKVSVSWYAKGGIVTDPTIVGNVGMGEKGAEAIVPLKPFWQKLEKMNSGNVTVNVYASEGMDVNQLADEVQKRIIETQNRRRLAWQ